MFKSEQKPLLWGKLLLFLSCLTIIWLLNCGFISSEDGTRNIKTFEAVGVADNVFNAQGKFNSFMSVQNSLSKFS